MFIRKSDGSLHQINEAFYQKLENHFFICESDLAYLYETPKVSGNETIVAMLNNNGYDINKIKDKRQRDQILSLLSDKIASDPNNINQIIKDFVANPDSLYNNQDNTQNQQNNTQGQDQTNNQDNTTEPNNQTDDNSNEDAQDNSNDDAGINDKGTPEQKQQVQTFAKKMNEAYINVIKKSGQGNNILKVANEQNPNKDWYKLEEVPADILLNAAKKNQKFVKFMLDIRIKNGVNSLNLSQEDKQGILNLYEEDSKEPYEMLRIVGWLSQKEGKNFDIFDFPITDYYVKRYNKTIANTLLDKLADGIVELNSGDWKFGDDALKQLAEENGLDKVNDKNQIIKKLKEKYSNDFIMYVLRNNDKEIKTANLNNADAEDIAKVLMEDKFVGSKTVRDVEAILKKAMVQATLVPFIDYLMSVNYNQVNKNGNDAETADTYAIKITMFGDFSASSVLQKARDIIKDGNLPFATEGLKPKISAYFSDISDTIFKNTENGNICRVRFQKGFPLLSVITKNVKAGYNKGKNFKGIINL